MAPFVGQKLVELTHHAGHKQPGHEQLAAVDTDRTVLTRMVNLHHAVADGGVVGRVVC